MNHKLSNPPPTFPSDKHLGCLYQTVLHTRCHQKPAWQFTQSTDLYTNIVYEDEDVIDVDQLKCTSVAVLFLRFSSV